MTKEKQYTRTVTVYNEAQLEDAQNCAKRAGCEAEVFNHSTKVKVSGPRPKMEKFVELYNKGIK